MKRGEAKAVYTVEASWVIAIFTGILVFMILSGFEMFSHALDTVTRPGAELDCVRLFYMSDKMSERISE